MLQQIDLSNTTQTPKIQICKPNKVIIGNIKESYNINLKQKIIGASELNFNTPYLIEKNHQLIDNPHISQLKNRYLIKFTLGEFVEWFIINNPSNNSDDNSDFLSIQAFSLEYELSDRYIRNYHPTSIILSDVINIALIDTSWTISSIPNGFDTVYRAFDVSSTSVLSFILEVAEKFNLIAKFNTSLRQIDFYKKDNLGQNKGLTVNERKYLKSISDGIDNTKFCTRLKVFGKDDLTINRINPTGQNYVEDYTYFMLPFTRDINKVTITHSDYLSDELCQAELNFIDLISSKLTDYNYLLSQLTPLQELLTTKQNELDELNITLKNNNYNIQLSVAEVTDLTVLLAEQTNVKNAITSKEAEIIVVGIDISAIQSQITALQSLLSLSNNFSSSLLAERNRFIIEKEITDSSYIDDVDLYGFAKDKLDEMCIPPISLQINIVNFLECITEQHNWGKIVLGDTVNVKHSLLNVNVTAQITETNFNFESRDIDLTISNIVKIENEDEKLSRLINKASYVGNIVDINKPEWDNALSNSQKYTDLQAQDINKSLINLAVNANIISQDGYITLIESNTLKTSLDQLLSESIEFLSVDYLDIATEKTNYQNALDALQIELDNWIGKSSYPIFITLVQKTTLTTKFENVQSTKSILINKISIVRENNAKFYSTSQLNNFISETYDLDLTGIQTQIDGKIESYFTDTDPNTWLETDRTKHNGDMWYSASTKLLKRYNGTTNLWALIEDQKAIDAYTSASTAQDTADSKRRVFIATPTVPYDIGDLWRIEGQPDFKICIVSKLISETYVSTDWIIATDTEGFINAQILDVETSLGSLKANIDDFSSDSILTLSEANSLKISLSQVNSESADLIIIADKLLITTEKYNYQTALNNLQSELNSWITVPNGNYTGTYPIVITPTNRTNIQTKFQDVQNKKSILINIIGEVRNTNATFWGIESGGAISVMNLTPLDYEPKSQFTGYSTGVIPNTISVASTANFPSSGIIYYTVHINEGGIIKDYILPQVYTSKDDINNKFYLNDPPTYSINSYPPGGGMIYTFPYQPQTTVYEVSLDYKDIWVASTSGFPDSGILYSYNNNKIIQQPYISKDANAFYCDAMNEEMVSDEVTYVGLYQNPVTVDISVGEIIAVNNKNVRMVVPAKTWTNYPIYLSHTGCRDSRRMDVGWIYVYIYIDQNSELQIANYDTINGVVLFPPQLNIYNPSPYIWQTPVSSYSMIAITYPNPSQLWGVMCNDTNRRYIYVNSTWHFYDTYSSNDILVGYLMCGFGKTEPSGIYSFGNFDTNTDNTPVWKAIVKQDFRYRNDKLIQYDLSGNGVNLSTYGTDMISMILTGANSSVQSIYNTHTKYIPLGISKRTCDLSITSNTTKTGADILVQGAHFNVGRKAAGGDSYGIKVLWGIYVNSDGTSVHVDQKRNSVTWGDYVIPPTALNTIYTIICDLDIMPYPNNPNIMCLKVVLFNYSNVDETVNLRLNWSAS